MASPTRASWCSRCPGFVKGHRSPPSWGDEGPLQLQPRLKGSPSFPPQLPLHLGLVMGPQPPVGREHLCFPPVLKSGASWGGAGLRLTQEAPACSPGGGGFHRLSCFHLGDLWSPPATLGHHVPLLRHINTSKQRLLPVL